jgi:1,4-alpha-glucan branching enzyme
VRNFLLANALYWLDEFHIDGLRVDAVASMLYLDYSRKPGEWLRNRYGGRENLEAIELLHAVNEAIREDHPGCFTVAEESTAWPHVTRPANEGGLGFAFKWNMGWMHDTLEYLEQDPVNRRWHHNRMTFGMMYEYSERFVNPLSHDEVVHMKGSLLRKMPGDTWQRFANLRLLLTYQYTRPGKVLLFMGTELAPWTEWNHDVSLDWSLRDATMHGEFCAFVAELGALYGASPSLWRDDHHPSGFSWIDVNDREQSVFSYLRRAMSDDGETMEDLRLVVLNCTPVPRAPYRIGCPVPGTYALRFSTDDARYGGSGLAVPATVEAEDLPYHGFEYSIELTLPPLAALVLAPLGPPSVGNRESGIAGAANEVRAVDSPFPIPDSSSDDVAKPREEIDPE